MLAALVDVSIAYIFLDMNNVNNIVVQLMCTASLAFFMYSYSCLFFDLIQSGKVSFLDYRKSGAGRVAQRTSFFVVYTYSF
jgi:hypothetical protein